MNRYTRAITLHEERRKRYIPGCAIPVLVIMLFLHPISLHTSRAAAGPDSTAAPYTIPTPAAGRSAIADIPQPRPCVRNACVSRASCDACHTAPGGAK